MYTILSNIFWSIILDTISMLKVNIDYIIYIVIEFIDLRPSAGSSTSSTRYNVALALG